MALHRSASASRLGVYFTASILAVVARPDGLAGQIFMGHVRDDQNDTPVATALVRLVDADGGERAITAADSSGAYRIVAPDTGVYRLVAERLGYEPFETPLLDAQSADGVYPLDLLMRRAPIPIRGIEVSAEEAEQEIRLMIGVSPRSLRMRPIPRNVIVEHAERAHDLTDVIRWSNAPGIVVREAIDGPCYQVRGRACLPVYLNGFQMDPALAPVIPLDMVYTMVVLFPGESIAYPTGAVHLYTDGWLHSGPR